jgi:hypothetical protein
MPLERLESINTGDRLLQPEFVAGYIDLKIDGNGSSFVTRFREVI